MSRPLRLRQPRFGMVGAARSIRSVARAAEQKSEEQTGHCHRADNCPRIFMDVMIGGLGGFPAGVSNALTPLLGCLFEIGDFGSSSGAKILSRLLRLTLPLLGFVFPFIFKLV